MRIHKRYLITVACATALTLLLTGGLIWVASSVAGTANTYRFQRATPDSRSGRSILTSGVDLSTVDPGDLLRDPSFEPFVVRDSMTVERVSRDAVVLGRTLQEPQGQATRYGSGFFDNASITVIGPSSREQKTKFSGRVVSFSIDQLTPAGVLQIPGEWSRDETVNAVATRRSGDGKVQSSVAVGSNGLILTGVHTQTPGREAFPDNHADLTAVAPSGSRWMAATRSGEVYVSEDGKRWEKLTALPLGANQADAGQLTEGKPEEGQEEEGQEEDGLFAAGQSGTASRSQAASGSQAVSRSQAEAGTGTASGSQLETEAGTASGSQLKDDISTTADEDRGQSPASTADLAATDLGGIRGAIAFKDNVYFYGPHLYAVDADGKASRVDLRDQTKTARPNDWVKSIEVAFNKLYVLAGDRLWSTEDGQTWMQKEVDRMFDSLTASPDGKTLLIYGAGRNVLVTTDGLTTHQVRRPWIDASLTSAAYGQIMLFDDETWLDRAPNGGLQITNDAAERWIRVDLQEQHAEQAGSDADGGKGFILSPTQLLCAGHGTEPALYDLEIRASLNTDHLDDQITPGDICLFEKELSPSEACKTIMADSADPSALLPWSHNDDVKIELSSDVPPGGGRGRCLLSPARRGEKGTVPTIMEQEIDPNKLLAMSSGRLCVLHIWLKDLGSGRSTTAQTATEVSATSSGQLEDNSHEAVPEFYIRGNFGERIATATRPSDRWEKQMLTFFLPASEPDIRNGKLTFGIRWKGDTTLAVDDIYLGEDRSNDQMVSSTLLDRLQKAAPDMIRFGYLGIGTVRARHDAWLEPSGSPVQLWRNGRWSQGSPLNLEDSLHLAKKLKSDPWLVISPFVSEADLLDLCEYIAGPTTSDLGRRRLSAGTAVPWVHQFERFVFEFSDPDGVFPTDQQRGGFVDRMIATLQQSPYYDQFKQKIIFVDGIRYSGDVQLSAADFHAMDFTPDPQLANGDKVAGLNEMMKRFSRDIPRKLQSDSDLYRELVRSYGYPGESQLIDGTRPLPLTSNAVLVFSALGRKERGVMIDVSADNDLAWDLARTLSSLSGYEPVDLKRLDNADIMAGPVYAFLFSNGRAERLVLVNTSDQVATVSLDLGSHLSSSGLMLLDDNGNEFHFKKFKPGNDVQLMPNSLAVAELGSQGQ